MAEKKVKAEAAINWKIAADRSIYGERVELKSLPGFWVQPRRLSKNGEAEVLAVNARQQMKKSAVRQAILAEAGSEPATDAQRMTGVLSDEAKERITIAITESMSAEDFAQLESKVVKIAYGIHAHNFNGKEEGGSLEWARSLTEYKDIFDEILALVEEKNLPL